ncbi:MAG: hypothetical protein IMW89_14675 [Ktedonobacteraceae bacterium]|nr:hypothetical protein [Ktedonobacteraceae bacterium]
MSMLRPFFWTSGRPFNRMWLWSGLLVLTLVLVGCGGSPASTAPNSSNTGSGNTGAPTTTGASTNSQGAAACDPAITVTFTEKFTPGKPDQYFFNPDKATIKTGQFINFVNQTDEDHTLVASPAFDLPSSVIDKNETQPVQFTHAGTFRIFSKDADHRGEMQVTVLPEQGKTCGIEEAKNTVLFTEKFTPGKPDQYSFNPQSVTIENGDSITFVNQTDEDHTLMCTPDAGIGRDLQIDENEQQIVKFPKEGTYTCSSIEHPDAKMTIIVK